MAVRAKSPKLSPNIGKRLGAEMFCTKCGNPIAGGDNPQVYFCGNCGQELGGKATRPATGNWALKVPESLNPVKSLKPFVASARARFVKFMSPRKILLVVAATAAVILASACVQFALSEYEITSEDRLEVTQILGEKEMAGLKDETCQFASSKIIPPDSLKVLVGRKETMLRVLKSPDTRSILVFKNRHAWASDSLESAGALLSAQIGERLVHLLSSNSRVRKSDIEDIATRSISQVQTLSLDHCDLEEAFKKSVEFSKGYNDIQSRVIAQANSAPWYPVGFKASFEGAIAWKWVDRYEDCYSCRYSHVEVISKEGCLGGLYAEVNFLHNGKAIDWTNDSVPRLSAGQRAILTFRSYNDNADQTEAPSFTCHQ